MEASKYATIKSIKKSPEMYVVLPEVLTEHISIGSPEFPDCAKAPLFDEYGDLQYRGQNTHLPSAGSKRRIKSDGIIGTLSIAKKSSSWTSGGFYFEVMCIIPM